MVLPQCQEDSPLHILPCRADNVASVNAIVAEGLLEIVLLVEGAVHGEEQLLGGIESEFDLSIVLSSSKRVVSLVSHQE